MAFLDGETPYCARAEREGEREREERKIDKQRERGRDMRLKN